MYLCQAPQMISKAGGGWGWVGESGSEGALKAVFFCHQIFSSILGETYSQDSRYDKCVNPTLG